MKQNLTNNFLNILFDISDTNVKFIKNLGIFYRAVYCLILYFSSLSLLLQHKYFTHKLHEIETFHCIYLVQIFKNSHQTPFKTCK